HRDLHPLAADGRSRRDFHRRGVRPGPEDRPDPSLRHGGRQAVFPALARTVDRGSAPRRARGGRRMTTDAPIDVDVLREEIRKTYTDVSTDQEQEFIFPTGRSWAVDLGYPEPELSRVPDSVVESFAGVANHWILGRADPSAVVLDLGCGAGTDLLIAAQMTGTDGRAIGVDMTEAMLDRGRDSAVEIGRVLRPGGRLQIADVVIHTEVSEDARKNIDLWTG